MTNRPIPASHGKSRGEIRLPWEVIPWRALIDAGPGGDPSISIVQQSNRMEIVNEVLSPTDTSYATGLLTEEVHQGRRQTTSGSI